MFDTQAAIERKKPRTDKAVICLDDELITLKLEADQAVKTAKQAAHDSNDPALHKAVKAAEKAAEAAKQAVADAQVTFVFQAIPSRRFREMLREHPPTDEDRAEGLGFNSDTFPQALLVAASATPKISDVQAEQMVREWSEGEIADLFGTAYTLQARSRSVPFT